MQKSLKYYTLILLLGFGFSCKSSLQDSASSPSFYEISSFYLHAAQGQGLNRENLFKNRDQLDSVFLNLAQEDLNGRDTMYLQCYYLNIYNLALIKQLMNWDNEDITPAFYAEGKFIVQGEEKGLSSLFNNEILPLFNSSEPYFLVHTGSVFDVLKDNQVYTREHFSSERKTVLASVFNNANYIRVKEKSHYLLFPELMNWTTLKSVEDQVQFINKYRVEPLPTEDFKIDHYPWSWKKKW